jgi:hypothetical protein
MSDDMLVEEHYSAALDEIYRLRRALAYEAGVLKAHLGYKTFPKSRRRHADEQVARLLDAARGHAVRAYADIPHAYIRSAVADAGVKQTFSRHDWESGRGEA